MDPQPHVLTTTPAIAAANGGQAQPPDYHRDLALAYARLGVKVFPCREKDFLREKKDEHGNTVVDDDGVVQFEGPTVKSPYYDKRDLAHGLKAATMDEAQIRVWWKRWPYALVGIAVGASGLLVIDPDRKDGIDGVEEWEKIKAEHGIDDSFSIVVRTPNKGQHIYFKMPAGIEIRNSEGAIKGRGINVRGHGGYTIAAGSVFADGRAYECSEPDFDLLKAIEANFLAAPPKELIALLLPPTPAREVVEPRQAPVASTTDSRGRKYALTGLREIEADLGSQREGSDRSTAVFRHAARLASMAARGWLTKNEAHDGLKAASERNGLMKKYGAKKFDEAFTNGFEKGYAEPHADLEQRPIVKANGVAAHPRRDDAPPPVAPPAEAGACYPVSDYRRQPDVIEEPMPLTRPIPPGQEFPIDALGDILGPAARAIKDIVQVPSALAACSVLSIASLAVQAHVDVVPPRPGKPRPVSIFLLPVLDSGDRKSAADSFAREPIETFYKERRERYDREYKAFKEAHDLWEFEIQAARAEARCKPSRESPNFGTTARQRYEKLKKVAGEEPQPPTRVNMIVDPGATVEGLYSEFYEGQCSMGIVSDEGGNFTGGHAMSEKNIVKSLAALNSYWDGKEILRTRSKENNQPLFGRRFTVAIMVQPAVVDAVLSSPLAKGSGFLARFLKCCPDSLKGTRLQKEPDAASRPALDAYKQRILQLLRKPQPYDDPEDERKGLKPRRLELSEEAAQFWIEQAEAIELEQRKGGQYAQITEFASKLLEHVCRIAAILAIVDDPDAAEISFDAFERACLIGDFFIEEELRLTGMAQVPEHLQRAEKLRVWLQTFDEEFIGTSWLLTHGPDELRIREKVSSAIDTLAHNGWLKSVPEDQVDAIRIKGKPVKKAWRIVREG